MAETLFTATHVWKLIDKMTALYRSLRGTSASGLGTGDGTYGASVLGDAIKDICEGSSETIFVDASLQLALNPTATKLQEVLNTNKAFVRSLGSFVAAVNSRCSLSRTVSTSITGIDTFMTWYNTGNASTYWQCMAPPEWYEMYYALYGSRPSSNNVYLQVLKDGTVTLRDDDDLDVIETFTDALYHKVVVGSSVTVSQVGYDIDETKFAGGFCYARWTSGAGSGSVTITIAGLDQNGDNETWTLTGTWGAGDFSATQTGVIFVPSTRAYSLITSVTSVTVSAGITDINLYVESRVSTGRIYPPT